MASGMAFPGVQYRGLASVEGLRCWFCFTQF